MAQIRKRVARTVNDVLSKLNLAVVRRDRHEAMARGQLQHERQALGRDARPLHESVRTLEPSSVGLLVGRGQPGIEELGQRVLVVGSGDEAALLADALRTTGRSVQAATTSGLAAVLEQAPADMAVVIVEPTPSEASYDLVHRLRFEQGRRVFTADQLLGGAAFFEAINQLVGVYVQPLSKALSYMAGAPLWEPISKLIEREPLAGCRQRYKSVPACFRCSDNVSNNTIYAMRF